MKILLAFFKMQNFTNETIIARLWTFKSKALQKMLLRSDEWDNEVDIAAHGLTWSGNGDTFHSFDGINLAEKWYQKRYLCRAIEVSLFKKFKYDLNICYRLIFPGRSWIWKISNIINLKNYLDSLFLPTPSHSEAR